MRFKDLEEGKDYTSDNIHHESKEFMCYRIKNRILWVVDKRELNNANVSGLTMYEINEAEFEEIPQYVTVNEAFIHMIKGNIAKFNEKEYKMVACELLSNISKYTYSHDDIFSFEMLEPKWILL